MNPHAVQLFPKGGGLNRESGLHPLQPDAHQPIAMLDYDDLHFRMAEDSQKGLRRPFQPKPVSRELQQTRQLSIQVSFLVSGGNSGVQRQTGQLLARRG